MLGFPRVELEGGSSELSRYAARMPSRTHVTSHSYSGARSQNNSEASYLGETGIKGQIPKNSSFIP